MSDFSPVETERSEGSTPSLKIAVEGCCHGALDQIYGALEKACESRGWTMATLDFLIICGDFQERISIASAIRNEQDLNCMSVPRKYRRVGDFYQYYSGEKLAPVLTLVIGGNHEASNYFSELYYGGWLAPNIYYLGAANVVRYGPYRIAGLSGIFHRADYWKPHRERVPYDRNEIRSVYHVRESDVSKLLRVRSPIDIGISHDWPRRVEWFGDYAKLFAERPHFFESAKKDNLGSGPAEQIMNLLRPRYWFSGHMHIKYSAVVDHTEHTSGDIFKDVSISDDLRSQLPRSMFRAAFRNNNSIPKHRPLGTTNTCTHFLGLDKPGPNDQFLELLEIDSPCTIDNASTMTSMQKTNEGKFVLHYDEEWLAIMRSSGGVKSASFTSIDIAPEGVNADRSNEMTENLHWVQMNITANDLLEIPGNFERHAPTYNPNNIDSIEQPCEYPNSQTEEFCRMLQIGNRFSVIKDAMGDEDHIIFE